MMISRDSSDEWSGLVEDPGERIAENRKPFLEGHPVLLRVRFGFRRVPFEFEAHWLPSSLP